MLPIDKIPALPDRLHAPFAVLMIILSGFALFIFTPSDMFLKRFFRSFWESFTMRVQENWQVFLVAAVIMIIGVAYDRYWEYHHPIDRSIFDDWGD